MPSNNIPISFQQLKDEQVLENRRSYYIASANQQNKADAYEAYIDDRRQNQYDEGTVVEKHHVVPKHAGGTDEASNLINLSIPDHIFAHWLLYKEKNSEKDKMAYLFRVSSSEEREVLRREMIAKNVEKYREEGRLFFDPNFQSTQGKKGGIKGGLANTEAQFKARQQVGQKYGAIVGKANQSSKLKDFLALFAVWHFEGWQDNNGNYTSEKRGKSLPPGHKKTTFFVVIAPKTTFKEVAETLNLFAPGSINMKTVSTMHKLVSGDRTRIFGWKIDNKLTRSEVDQGALNNYADAHLLFYENIIPE